MGLKHLWILVSVAGPGTNPPADTKEPLYIFLTGVGKKDFFEFGDAFLLRSLWQVFLMREHFL